MGFRGFFCFAAPRTVLPLARPFYLIKPTETICFPYQNDNFKLLFSKSRAFSEAPFAGGVSFPAANARRGGNSAFTPLKSPIICPTFGLESLVSFDGPGMRVALHLYSAPSVSLGGRFSIHRSGPAPRAHSPGCPGLCHGLAAHWQHNGPDGALYPA